MGQSYRFPHYKLPCRAVQPDYVSWHSVQVGMSREEVIELLGKPCRDKFMPAYTTNRTPYWLYGFIQLPMMPHPRTYSFKVGFNNANKVFVKIDPFGGVFSADGRPTKPIVVCPAEGVFLSHYPHIVDMRWYPVSGEYPIWYEVEVGGYQYGSSPDAKRTDGAWSETHQKSEVPFPFSSGGVR